MAKKNKGNGAGEPDAGNDTGAVDGTQGITIKGITFTAPAPYTEGHTLTANEAAALNGVLGENLRNNFASNVAKAKETAGESGLTDAALAELQEKFQTYAQSYTFGAKRVAKAPADPVGKEAHKIAKALLMEHLRKNSMDPKSIDGATMEKYVQQIIAKYPHVSEEARKRVEATKQLAAVSIGSLLEASAGA